MPPPGGRCVQAIGDGLRAPGAADVFTEARRSEERPDVVGSVAPPLDPSLCGRIIERTSCHRPVETRKPKSPLPMESATASRTRPASTLAFAEAALHEATSLRRGCRPRLIVSGVALPPKHPFGVVRL